MNNPRYPEAVLTKMQEIVDNCMGDAAPYCEANCPLHIDVRSYVRLIADGRYADSLAKVRETLFLPAVLGRVCMHPCEAKCKREEIFRQPMSIAALKRFVADNYDDDVKWNVSTSPNTGKRVAVIGAGPAGAQVAYDLAKKGHTITIYDKLNSVGGMMRVGIPEYRLPRDVIDYEYSILDKLGIHWQLGIEVGKDITMQQLDEQYDAVVLAIGAHRGSISPLVGAQTNGVRDAVGFLKDISLHKPVTVGQRVAVIGGGNVAIDAARSARRIGAKEVYIVYRRSIDEMPAEEFEIDDAKAEGVIFKTLLSPVLISEENGSVNGLVMQVMRLGEPDQSGRKKPIPVEGSQQTLALDNVIFAVGQTVESDFLAREQTTNKGYIIVDEQTGQTANPKVFACGDATGQTVIVVEAMAHARHIAESVDRYLNGVDLTHERAVYGDYHTPLETNVKADEQDLPRIATPKLDAQDRVLHFKEVDLGLSEAQAQQEASRCLDCECKLCMSECIMLNDYCECPKDLFENILKTGEVIPEIPYSCNMCNQCTIACPKDIQMAEQFFEIRKAMVMANNGKSPMKGHGAIDMHQMLGFSKLFTTVRPAKRSDVPTVKGK